MTAPRAALTKIAPFSHDQTLLYRINDSFSLFAGTCKEIISASLIASLTLSL